MGKIKDYEQLEHFDGSEVFVVETENGTKSVPFALLNDRIVDVVEDKSEMLNQTDTELSVESNNAIANSAVAKVLGNGTLIGFAKVDSLDDLGSLSSRYPEGIPENAFLILYVTQDLSYTDPDTQFDCPPGIYLFDSNDFTQLCPGTESINTQFNTVNNLIKDWGVVAASKANVSDLNKAKQDLEEVIANYLEVADAIGLWKTVTAGITSFDNMFQGRTDITKIPELDMSSGTTARYMCNGCTNLKSFVNSTTGNVTSLYHAFRDCTSAEIIEIDTSKNTQFNGTFWGCSSLKELVIDMSRADGMDYMCRNCSSLVSIKTLDFTGGSALASGKNYSNMFTGCPSLVHVEIVPGTIKGNLSFVNSPNLDFDSVASIFAGLADMSDYDTHTLTLHANVQITQAQADGAVAKNWNIVGGTVNG